MAKWLLLSIDEAAGFAAAARFDASAVRDALADACANKFEPPCRAPIEIEEVEGALVLRLDVPELDPVDKPCFVGARSADLDDDLVAAYLARVRRRSRRSGVAIMAGIGREDHYDYPLDVIRSWS